MCVAFIRKDVAGDSASDEDKDTLNALVTAVGGLPSNEVNCFL